MEWELDIDFSLSDGLVALESRFDVVEKFNRLLGILYEPKLSLLSLPHLWETPPSLPVLFDEVAGAPM